MTDDVAVSTEIQVDDETRAALLLFNERVEATAAQERGAKRVAKAERAKDEAAAVVRKLRDNPDATAEQKAEAEAAYKEAAAAEPEPAETSADEEPAAEASAEPAAASSDDSEE